jgi:hypothetical protein
MVLASLTPYKTVGAFFALLMTFSALTTLVLLPGLLRMIGGRVLASGGVGATAHP